jgi:hypothetical protein
MVRKLLASVVALLVGFVVVAAMQPSEFRVARSAVIAAPAAEVFAEVNDLHRWEAWSPYVKRDPAMQKRYEGAPAGIGAVYAWSGNGEVGEGRATIVESRPNELVRVRLEFVRPFAATSTAEFAFRPSGEATAVTWSLAGTNGLVAKAMGLLVDMDAMIGGDFETGLAAMKATVERS